eukprot:CAMPEP_0202468424 /NCGR_PEP_ID=MMETSP1360-20130828/75195_1 /ASSEMBLY_ACC=CAM_ASM_000848 /TAXON_ID=515479 /ORGANISM="Licmophora paradoxa, Strain CCMP2313" /LENGTH=69 /DNA_ID=CAMNT_0049093349 /DNA_START=69 /DNA_END=274 /DNA_ORIENTATION=+
MILCRAKSADPTRQAQETAIFDYFLELTSCLDSRQDFRSGAEAVFKMLDQLIEHKTGVVVVMFDEAHYL